MHASGAELWREWGRSIAMTDVTPAAWQALDLFVVWLALALPLPRVLARRGTRLDWVLVAARLALVAPLAGPTSGATCGSGCRRWRTSWPRFG